MTRRRVYLAVGSSELRALATRGLIDPVGVPAFAVTGAARAADPDQDEEEAEYDAFLLASRAVPPGRVPGSGVVPHRAVVVSADLVNEAVRDVPPANDGTGGPDQASRADARGSHSGYEVDLAGPVRLAEVAAIHVADPGADPDQELAWYDVTELAQVLRQLEESSS